MKYNPVPENTLRNSAGRSEFQSVQIMQNVKQTLGQARQLVTTLIESERHADLLALLVHWCPQVIFVENDHGQLPRAEAQQLHNEAAIKFLMRTKKDYEILEKDGALCKLRRSNLEAHRIFDPITRMEYDQIIALQQSHIGRKYANWDQNRIVQQTMETGFLVTEPFACYDAITKQGGLSYFQTRLTQ